MHGEVTCPSGAGMFCPLWTFMITAWNNHSELGAQWPFINEFSDSHQMHGNWWQKDLSQPSPFSRPIHHTWSTSASLAQFILSPSKSPTIPHNVGCLAFILLVTCLPLSTTVQSIPPFTHILAAEAEETSIVSKNHFLAVSEKEKPVCFAVVYMHHCPCSC